MKRLNALPRQWGYSRWFNASHRDGSWSVLRTRYREPGELDEQLDKRRRSLPNEYGWLPREFCGTRGLDDARRDLLCIANADIPTNHVNLRVDPDDGARWSARGWLRAPGREQQQLVVLLNGSPAFTFDSREFRGAWLSVCDDSFYGLRLDLGWGRVHISDASY